MEIAEYKSIHDIVCISNDHIKHCALYFDRIIPVTLDNVLSTMPEQIEAKINKNVELNIDNEIFKQPWNTSLLTELAELQAKFFKYRTRTSSDGVPLGASDLDYIQDTVHPELGSFRSCFRSILKKYGILRKYPVLTPSESIFGNIRDSRSILATVIGLNLIDANKASWEQILEFRRDDEAKKKLRRFRLFLYQNYQGMSRDFIIDDLMKRIDDYEQECKEFGFKTISSSLGLLLNSKSLIATGIGVLASIFTGHTCIASITGTTGLTLELGKIALNIVDTKHSFRNFESDHDLAYLFDIRKRIRNV